MSEPQSCVEYRMSDILKPGMTVEQGWRVRMIKSPSETYVSKGDRIFMDDGAEYEVTFGGGIKSARVRRITIAPPAQEARQ